MNPITQYSIVDLVSIRTGSASISLAGVDVKDYDGKAKIVVITQGGASVVATLQHNDVQAYDDSGWAAAQDADGNSIAVTPGTATATTTVWEVDISSLKKYIRVVLTNASTVYAGVIAFKKYR
ncbi:MAG: hypothetical protein KKH94_11390 [Candidatus Omnitrophica bacterium]|nr:hypothetical protein [Candidatus Omnitrophota bacterium]